METGNIYTILTSVVGLPILTVVDNAVRRRFESNVKIVPAWRHVDDADRIGNLVTDKGDILQLGKHYHWSNTSLSSAKYYLKFKDC